MKVDVKVIIRTQATLPESAVCRVELRDESLANGPSVTVASYEESVNEFSGVELLVCTLEADDSVFVRRDINVWAHLSLTGGKQIQIGDFVTMQTYPVDDASVLVSVVVELQPVSS